MKAALFLLMAAAAAPVAAAPASAVGEARVEWAYEPKPRIVLDEDTLWRCKENACTGRLDDEPLLRLRACRALARNVRRVVSFSTPSGTFGAQELARCNGRRG